MTEKLQNIENLIRLSTDETERTMLLELKNNMKISLIKEVHKYSIKHLEKCDRWNTYVKTATGRKEIKAKTEQELYEKLWEWYGFTRITLYSLFSSGSATSVTSLAVRTRWIVTSSTFTSTLKALR